MRKVSQFDPKVGSLYNYAKEEVMREMRRAMRRFGRKDMGVGINDTYTHLDYVGGACAEDVPSPDLSPEDACLESERGKILRNVLSTLTPREHLVIRRRFFAARECTQKELAEEMGISRQLVELTEYQALMKLREALGDDAEELLG
jgi:RNA polymerase sigma factor (sigma-70 family)